MADSKYPRKTANHVAVAAPVASAGYEKMSDEEVLTLTKLLLKAKATNNTRAIAYFSKNDSFFSGAGSSGSGGMSDASKRRFAPETPQPSHEVAKDEGFDLVGVAHVDEETRDRIAAGLDEDPAFFLPPSVENVKVWGDTLITMDKYQKQNVSYRDLVVSAYAGNAEASKYLTKIYNTYLNAGFERLSQGMECKNSGSGFGHVSCSHPLPLGWEVCWIQKGDQEEVKWRSHPQKAVWKVDMSEDVLHAFFQLLLLGNLCCEFEFGNEFSVWCRFWLEWWFHRTIREQIFRNLQSRILVRNFALVILILASGVWTLRGWNLSCLQRWMAFSGRTLPFTFRHDGWNLQFFGNHWTFRNFEFGRSMMYHEVKTLYLQKWHCQIVFHVAISTLKRMAAQTPFAALVFCMRCSEMILVHEQFMQHWRDKHVVPYSGACQRVCSGEVWWKKMAHHWAV